MAKKAKKAPSSKVVARHQVAAAKKERFIAEYLVTMNATESARRAGYTGTDHVLAVTGSRLLMDADVKRAVEAAQAELLEIAGADARSVVTELTYLAHSDMGRFLDISDDGRAELNFKKIKEGDTRCISEFSQEEVWEGPEDDRRLVRKTKIKLHGKEGPLRLLGQRQKQWDGVDPQQRTIEKWVIAVPVEQPSKLPIKVINVPAGQEVHTKR